MHPAGPPPPRQLTASPATGLATAADSRLSLPPLPPLHLSRPRLLEAVDAAAGVPLTLVAAGAGTGKTVLLSEWARRQTGRTAWLSVGPADDDPRRFWSLFLRALRAGGVLDALAPSSTLSGAAPADVLDSLPVGPRPGAEPVTLVVDDAHLLTHPEIVRGLDLLVRGWHPQLRLVLSARHDPLLPLHRYRLEGLLAELRAAQLALTAQEGEALLAAHEVHLPADSFDRLMARTEGWMTGLRLSAMRMRGTSRPADFVTELALDQGSVGEYLMEEVLRGQPEPVRRLLVETSFLDVVSGPLAESVTGIPGCADLLADLARDNSFVIPLDPACSSFRRHQLFGEILRYLLRGRGRDVERRLYDRAARWYAEEGDLGNALTWASRAGDVAHACRLLVGGGLARAYVERTDLSGCELAALPLEALPGDATRTAAALAVTAVQADRRTALAEMGRSTPGEGDDAEVRLTRLVAELMLAETAGDTRRIEQSAARALALLEEPLAPRVRGLRAALLLARARAAFWDGRDADEPAEAALHAADQDGASEVALGCLGLLALSGVLTSRPAHAAVSADRASRLRAELGEVSACAYLSLADALRAFYRADLDSMGRCLQLAAASPDLDRDGCLARFTSLLHAQQLAHTGRVVEARDRLVLDLRDAPRQGGGRLHVWRDLMLATIEVELGRPNAALTVTEPYRGSPLGGPMQVARVRAHLALGDAVAARRDVRRALTADAPHLNRYLRTELMLCDGQAAMAEGDVGRAVELVVRALDLAQDAVILPFVRYADVFAPLLARHVSLAERWPGIAGATSAGPASDAAQDDVEGARLPAQRVVPDGLTERERTILRMLATNLTVAEMAEELCVSANTVKTHVASIYRKLGARRRREAVVRARELELI